MRRHHASLASSYDRTVGDWHEAISRKGQVLDAIIGSALGPSRWRVLDCACGIGTQTIGLALRGHRVLGTDVSPEMIARAESETAAAGVDARYQVADMRTLERAVTGSFDAVVCCDNSYPDSATATVRLLPWPLGGDPRCDGVCQRFVEVGPVGAHP